MNSLSFLAHPWYVSRQLVVSLYSCLHLVSSVLTHPVVSLSSFSRPPLPFSLSLLPLRASARAPILIFDVQVRPVKIVHFSSCLTGSSRMSNVHLTTLFQKTSLLLHHVMESKCKKKTCLESVYFGWFIFT